MKSKIFKGMILSTLLQNPTAFADGFEDYAMAFFKSFSFGVEIGSRNVFWEENMGKSHFPSNVKQYAPFVGIHPSEYFEFRFGYLQSERQSQVKKYADDAIVLSNTEFTGGTTNGLTSYSTMKLKGSFFTDATAQLPLESFIGIPLYVGFLVGINQISYDITTELLDENASNPTNIQIATFDLKKQTTLNIGLSAKYRFNQNHFLTFNFKSESKEFEDKRAFFGSTEPYQIKFNKVYTANLGLLYKI